MISRKKAKHLLIALTAIALLFAVIQWGKVNDERNSETPPEFVVGDLGGMKVKIPSYYVDLLEYEGDPGWSGRRNGPAPVRTYQSRIISFGVTVRYPDMAGLSSPAMWADKGKYTAVDTPWISMGVTSGPIYPGDGFMERGAQRVIDSIGTRSPDVFKKEGEKLFGGLDLYVQQGESIDGKPRRESESDIYIYQSENGRVKSDIRCSNAKYPATLCQHTFTMEDDDLHTQVSILYRRTMLVHWQDLQQKARQLILSWKASENPPHVAPSSSPHN